jgi:hypothetical protein
MTGLQRPFIFITASIDLEEAVQFDGVTGH